MFWTLTLGHHKDVKGHIRVTLGHCRITIGHPFSFLFFLLCKHKANTTELYSKVRQTCYLYLQTIGVNKICESLHNLWKESPLIYSFSFHHNTVTVVFYTPVDFNWIKDHDALCPSFCLLPVSARCMARTYHLATPPAPVPLQRLNTSPAVWRFRFPQSGFGVSLRYIIYFYFLLSTICTFELEVCLLRPTYEP